MRGILLILALAPALLVGCGDDDGETTVAITETVTEAETTEAGTAEGPQGELTQRGIGSVEAGLTTAEVRAEFGPPDHERQVPGCPLAGPNAPPILQWTWEGTDGSTVLDFDVSSEKLVSYRTTSTELESAAGVRVGDPFQALRRGYGDQLQDLPLGAPANERVGLWYIGNPERLWQLFDLRGGKVRNIQGGDIQICE